MIRLENFTKIYGSGKNAVKAVDDVSFEVEKGSVTALLGPNGAGKTTIIKAICALHYATEGRVLVSNDDSNFIDACKNPVAVKKLVGYVPEIPVLDESFTVFEYLSMRCRLFGLGMSETGSALLSIIRRYSLDDVVSQKILSLSKGYRQRLSFAAALINDPPVLVLDEPTSGLDPLQISQIRKYIEELAEEKTVILSTHLMQEVSALCRNILIISHGKLKASGTASEIALKHDSRTLEEAFLKITGPEQT